ncbi:MAG: hypothetical protein QOK44_4854, partial [Betaproteobacteria bacterium]|nr:hypothetical protein [Betaproteobacteria bacterium]
RLDFDGNDAAEGGIERERDAEGGQRNGGVAQPSEKRVNQRMRKLMQLGRNDERQEEEDRHADGQGAVRLYGALPIFLEPDRDRSSVRNDPAHGGVKLALSLRGTDAMSSSQPNAELHHSCREGRNCARWRIDPTRNP